MLIEDLDVAIDDSRRTIRRAVVRENIIRLYEVFERLRMEGNAAEISAKIVQFLELYRRLMSMRVYMEPERFLYECGLNQLGKVVVLEVGMLNFEVLSQDLRRIRPEEFHLYMYIHLLKAGKFSYFEVDLLNILEPGFREDLRLRIYEEFNPEQLARLWQ